MYLYVPHQHVKYWAPPCDIAYFGRTEVSCLNLALNESPSSFIIIIAQICAIMISSSSKISRTAKLNRLLAQPMERTLAQFPVLCLSLHYLQLEKQHSLMIIDKYLIHKTEIRSVRYYPNFLHRAWAKLLVIVFDVQQNSNSDELQTLPDNSLNSYSSRQ